MDANKADMGYLIGQTARWLRALLAEELRFHGLDDTTYIILYYSRDAGDAGMSTKALSGQAEMSFAEVATAAKRLARDGWITELPDPADSESRIIRVTAKTESVIPVLTDAAHWAIERGLNGFTDDEVAQLRGYLIRMQANLR